MLSSEYNQPCPFFFTPEGATLPLVGCYRGASAFLIGGGPSFEDIDKSKLQPVWTMTLNNAVHSYRSNANCSVDHPNRFSYSMWLDPTIQKFVPMASFEEPLWDNRLLNVCGQKVQQWHKADFSLAQCPSVVGFRRNEIFNASRFLYENTINWGEHKAAKGRRSVMLPALRILFLLGFRNVYLLGIDWEMNIQKSYHFPEQRTKAMIGGNLATYKRLSKWLNELQPYFQAEGFIVKNCNPQSKLEVFPYIALNEAITDATDTLGVFSLERVTGMYQSQEGKLAQLASYKPGACPQQQNVSPKSF